MAKFVVAPCTQIEIYIYVYPWGAAGMSVNLCVDYVDLRTRYVHAIIGARQGYIYIYTNGNILNALHLLRG